MEGGERRKKRKKEKEKGGEKMSGPRVTLRVEAFSTFQNPKFNPSIFKIPQ